MDVPSGMQYRDASIERGGVDEKHRILEVSFASETPVERFWGVEILEISARAIDFGRLRASAPVLVNHDPDDQVGVVEQSWIDTRSRKARARLRFSDSERGREIFKDVIDGIRPNVSFSYEVHEMIPHGEDERGLDRFLVTRYQPQEISIVPIPADHTVGFQRGKNQPAVRTRNQMKPLLQSSPTDPAGGGAPGDDPKYVSTQADEIQTALRLGRKLKAPEEKIWPLIHRGMSASSIFNWLIENGYEAKPTYLDPAIGMNEPEIKRYSVVRAINLLSQKKPLDGLELEASRAVEKKFRRAAEGFYIPPDVLNRSIQSIHGLSPAEMLSLTAGLQMQRALSAGVASAGGYTVGTQVLGENMIELFRNKALIVALGANVLGGLVGDIAIPRQTGTATTYWLSESAQGALADQTFGQLALTPHRLFGATAYSKQLLAQSSLDVEAFVRGDLMSAMSVEQDRAAINGINATGEPLGILNTTGLGSVTFGAAPTWQKVVDFETTVANANADVMGGRFAYLTTPSVRGKWKTTVKVASQAVFLWGDDGRVNTYRAEATKNVPGDKVIFGNFADFQLAQWDSPDVVVDPFTLATSGQVRVVINFLMDTGIRHVGSFAVSTDSGAQ